MLLDIGTAAADYELARDFKDEFDFHRQAKGQAGDAKDDTGQEHPRAKDPDEEFGSSVGDSRMVPEVALRRDIEGLRDAGSPDTATT
jgi:hypothetical protein